MAQQRRICDRSAADRLDMQLGFDGAASNGVQRRPAAGGGQNAWPKRLANTRQTEKQDGTAFFLRNTDVIICSKSKENGAGVGAVGAEVEA